MKKQTIFLALGALIIAISSCGSKNEAAQQAPPAPATINAVQVVKKQVTGIDQYPSTLVPLNEVEIRPQISGYITNIYVKDGQKVSKGQKLYEIDKSKYQAAKQQAEANVAIAEANIARITKDLVRYEKLLEQEAIATQLVDYAKSDLLNAKSQLIATQAQLRSTSTDLAYSEITAPFAGTIGISNVRLGAQVSPGQPLLNTLSSVDPIQADFVINEKEIPRFNRLLKSNDQPDSLFTIQFGDGSRYPFPGKLTIIDRAVGRQTGTINLRVEFPNPNGDLIPGMTVSLRVINQDYGDQMTIPYRAVTEQMGEYFVYLIDKENVVHQQKVALGTLLGSEIVVRKGLEPGQNIVLDGLQKVKDGAKVSIQ
jgi:membrane fusion protein, multidrug efflux system